MEFLGFMLALTVSFGAYLIEKRRWETVVRTTDADECKLWCSLLTDYGIPYRVKTWLMLRGDSWETVYKLNVLSREAAQAATMPEASSPTESRFLPSRLPSPPA